MGGRHIIAGAGAWRRAVLLTTAVGLFAFHFNPAMAQAVGQPYGGLPVAPRIPDAVVIPDEDAAPPDRDSDVPARPEAQDLRPWTISPYAVGREAFTDNVRLTPHGKSDFVTSLTPGVTVRGQNRRVQMTADGSVTDDIYAKNSGLNGYRYNFYGNGLGEIVSDYLFLDARSSISAQTINTNSGVSAIDRSLPGNQVQVLNNSISPYLSHEFGDWAAGELRYRASFVNYSDANTNSQVTTVPGGTSSSSLSDSTTNQFSLNLHAGPRFTVFRWAVDASQADTSYARNRDVRQNSETLTGEYAFSREVAVIAKVGEDGYRDNSLSSSSNSNASWRIGTRLTPGPRTDLLVEGGSRYGGDYFAGDARYKISESLVASASHNETVGTQQSLASDGLSQLMRDDEGRLVDPLSGIAVDPNASGFNFVGQSFSLKSTRLALDGTSGRNSYDLSFQYDQRVIGVAAFDQTGRQNQDVYTIGGALSRRLTRTSDAGISLSYGKDKDSLAAASYNILQAGASYNYDFSPTLRGTAAYRHYGLSNEVATGYDENVILVSLRKSF